MTYQIKGEREGESGKKGKEMIKGKEIRTLEWFQKKYYRENCIK